MLNDIYSEGKWLDTGKNMEVFLCNSDTDVEIRNLYHKTVTGLNEL